MFILHNLIELVCKSKKSIYCTFIDLKQAFDRVWREGLWEKISNYNINGKCLRIIQSIYSNIKSCVIVNGNKTDFFLSNIGVRQGENLSPLLFNLFLNDVEDYLRVNGAQGIFCSSHDKDETIVTFLKMFVLLYADDTVILSDSAESLQNALNIYAQYCETWKLTVNLDKSKVMIFSKGTNDLHTFSLNGTNLEIVSEYKYLGVYFSKNNSFHSTKKHIAEQGTKALYSLLSKARTLQLPVNIQIDLFDKLVKPILLYGCEVWGFGNNDVIERVQLKFLKYILNAKNSTPNYIVYGETGVFPLQLDINARIISYWAKINSPESLGRLSNHIYSITHSIYKFSKITNRSHYFKWIHNVKNILCNYSYSGIWDSHTFDNKTWLTKAVKQKSKDTFLNEWYADVESDTNYRIFKHKFEFEPYLTQVSNNLKFYFTSYRTRNHRLPIETGRWSKIRVAHKDRKCNLCKNEIGDEYHYLLVCDSLTEHRKQYISRAIIQRPNIMKYESLMNTNNKKLLASISKFIKVIYTVIKESVTER